MLAAVSAWMLPGLIGLTLLIAVVRGINVYEEFVTGAADGARLAVQVMPYVIGIYIATGLFRESGFLSGLTHVFAPFLRPFGLPAEVLPLIFIRPFSLAAAIGVVSDLLKTYGPDSFIGLLAAVMLGSSETTFYVLTLYLGAVGIRRSLYAVPLCLLGDIVGYLASLWLTTLFWGMGGFLSVPTFWLPSSRLGHRPSV
ncbi:MAG: spore maturation protein [Clostridia bacterium]|nr:spore maturation protein [Clostridia bacterium]